MHARQFGTQRLRHIPPSSFDSKQCLSSVAAAAQSTHNSDAGVRALRNRSAEQG